MGFDIFDSIFEAAPDNGTENAKENTKQVVIDGSTASLAANTRWRGLGMVSANNTSRLLLDYKAQHPKRYNEIMNYIFGKDGLAVSHLKIEMGSDVNSSSGTEPCVMRFADEKANVTRGAGFRLAADAKRINPALTLDMLWWSEPRWVTDSADDMEARYKWYKQTLVSAYETYGLEFDYVSANRNERTIDIDWIKYLSQALKRDDNTPYDFSRIKVVASDEEANWVTARKMLGDGELLASVDVVASHYTSHSTPQVQELIKCWGKEAWFAEASAPMSYAQGTYRYDGTGSGLSDINGVLDIANRIITMYPQGGMTLHEFQPVVAAFYDGATYYQKQLIMANEPWSGFYMLDSGYFMALHFSQFFIRGWSFVDSACAGDGKIGGDGHAIVDAVYSYMTACNHETGDYSMVITNTTSEPITYNIEVKNLKNLSAPVDVWETRGPDSGSYDENYFKKIDTVTPFIWDETGSYSVTVKPYSMVTVSTLKKRRPDCSQPEMSEEERVMQLPYEDDFTYPQFNENFLSSRGGAPLYTTDQGGAFEVIGIGGNMLCQKITEELRAEEWGLTPKPTTCFGDDRWYNYSVTCEVLLTECVRPEECYAGCGVRYNGSCGWWLQLFADGTWKLNKNQKAIKVGTVPLLENNVLKVEAVGGIIRAWVNGQLVAYVDCDAMGIVHQAAGRAALFSSYDNNFFTYVKVEPAKCAAKYVHRYDCTDANMSYKGDWSFNTMGSFNNYKRTSTTGNEGAVVEIAFNGTGIALLGPNHLEGTSVSVEIDGVRVAEDKLIPDTEAREVFWRTEGLADGEHIARVTVERGSVTFDSAEVTYPSGDALDEYEEITEPVMSEMPVAEDTPVTEMTESEEPVVVIPEQTERPEPITVPLYKDDDDASEECVATYSVTEEAVADLTDIPLYVDEDEASDDADDTVETESTEDTIIPLFGMAVPEVEEHTEVAVVTPEEQTMENTFPTFEEPAFEEIEPEAEETPVEVEETPEEEPMESVFPTFEKIEPEAEETPVEEEETTEEEPMENTFSTFEEPESEAEETPVEEEETPEEEPMESAFPTFEEPKSEAEETPVEEEETPEEEPMESTFPTFEEPEPEAEETPAEVEETTEEEPMESAFPTFEESEPAAEETPAEEEDAPEEEPMESAFPTFEEPEPEAEETPVEVEETPEEEPMESAFPTFEEPEPEAEETPAEEEDAPEEEPMESVFPTFEEPEPEAEETPAEVEETTEEEPMESAFPTFEEPEPEAEETPAEEETPEEEPMESVFPTFEEPESEAEETPAEEEPIEKITPEAKDIIPLYYDKTLVDEKLSRKKLILPIAAAAAGVALAAAGIVTAIVLIGKKKK